MEPVTPTFSENGLDFYEVCRQEYADGHIAAGFIQGHEVDSVYLQLHRADEPYKTYLLRPDELAAIGMCASTALWSLLITIHEQPGA